MSLTPYSYGNFNPSLRPARPQKMVTEPTPLAPARSAGFEAAVLEHLDGIKALLETPPPTPTVEAPAERPNRFRAILKLAF
jgi:hypothetical protein